MGQEDKRWAKIIKRCQKGVAGDALYMQPRDRLRGKLSLSCLAAPAASVTRDQDVDQGA